jgi:nucleotide-binding universal stress UspA family protein
MPGIVVGFDGSENAEYALDWAIRHAAAEHIPVTILTVDEVAVNPYTGDPALMPEDAAMLEHAQHAAEEAAAKATSQFAEPDRPAVTVTALSGFVGQELIDASRDADLLVIGSRGQRGFPALRVSEIATKVAHYADCPVVIVPPAR